MTNEMAAIRADRTLEGRYELGERLGAGGFGVVYRARQLSTGQDVAVKVLAVGDSPDPAAREARFQRELDIGARLCHPHVVPLVDAGRTLDGKESDRNYRSFPVVRMV